MNELFCWVFFRRCKSANLLIDQTFPSFQCYYFRSVRILDQCTNFSHMYYIDINLLPMCFNALFCYMWSNVNFQRQINYYESHEIGINSFIKLSSELIILIVQFLLKTQE